MNISHSKLGCVHHLQISRYRDKKQGLIYQPFSSTYEQLGYFVSLQASLLQSNGFELSGWG